MVVCLGRHYEAPREEHHFIFVLQLVAPASLTETIPQDLHEGVMVGHLGKDKMFEQIKE